MFWLLSAIGIDEFFLQSTQPYIAIIAPIPIRMGPIPILASDPYSFVVIILYKLYTSYPTIAREIKQPVAAISFKFAIKKIRHIADIASIIFPSPLI